MPHRLMHYFQTEARQILGHLSEDLLCLESQPDPEVCARLLRHAHTLKGAARVVEQAQIAESMHELESALEPYRTKAHSLPAEEQARLLRILDSVEEALTRLETSLRDGHPSTTPDTASQEAPANSATSLATLPTASRTEEVEALLDPMRSALSRLQTVRRELSHFDRQRALCELLVSQLKAPGRGKAPSSLGHDLLQEGRRAEQSLRAGLEQLQTDLRQVQSGLERLRLTRVDSIFAALRRAVREAEIQAHRKVEFVTRGGDIRLEARLLAAVQPPLLQAVANSIAHGIEDASTRQARGKPAQGQMALEVRRDGREVVFRLTDDGRGIDLAAARRELRAQGRDLGNASDQEVMDALMHSGISTAETVTLASGRGIGLGLIRESVAAVGGTAQLKSQPGRSTELELRIPWSRVVLEFLQIQTGLPVASGLHQVLLPLEDLQAVVRLEPELISHHGSERQLHFEGKTHRLVSLSAALGQAHPREPLALVLRTSSGPLAIATSSFRAVVTASLLPLPSFCPASPAIAGAILDDDGAVRTVLDAEGLQHCSASTTELTPAPDRGAVRLLVIDDSLTTRSLQESVLTSAGYKVDLASSAEEGLKALPNESYALILVDVEMPGMDGFRFVEELRSGPYRHLPVVMVTSRSSPQDRQRASDVGAQGFVDKGEYTPKTLLSTIDKILRQDTDA